LRGYLADLTSRGEILGITMDSSTEDTLDYLKTKGSETEPLLGKVAPAPSGKIIPINIVQVRFFR
jgi:hypothetical protein